MARYKELATHKEKALYFSGGYGPLSNCHMVNLRVYGNHLQSLEHACQWRKAIYLECCDVVIHIMNTTTAAHAKQITDDKLDTTNSDW